MEASHQTSIIKGLYDMNKIPEMVATFQLEAYDSDKISTLTLGSLPVDKIEGDTYTVKALDKAAYHAAWGVGIDAIKIGDSITD